MHLCMHAMSALCVHVVSCIISGFKKIGRVLVRVHLQHDITRACGVGGQSLDNLHFSWWFVTQNLLMWGQKLAPVSRKAQN